jgi:hypothetical protein
MTSAANMKRAERFNLGNHGPALTAEEEQEAKKGGCKVLLSNWKYLLGSMIAKWFRRSIC